MSLVSLDCQKTLSTDRSMLSAGMRPQEYERICELLSLVKAKNTLEIGMANGGSAVVIGRYLEGHGGESHTSIDPFQSAKDGWNGQGIAAVREAHLEHLVTVIEDFDYLALPKLVDAEARFDFILLDGWHSFDYTFLDMFYADLLLNVGGILAVHDTGWVPVYRVCKFLESHKPYELIGPPISVHLKHFLPRIQRRMLQALRGINEWSRARSRREEWFSLGAYRKISNQQVPQGFDRPF
jgi:predicted O-methyltransferase YrrM